MSAGWHVDAREFQAALVAYAAASRRSFPEILNKVGRDILLTATRFLPQANRGAIDDLRNKKWWYGYVVKRMQAAKGGVSNIPKAMSAKQYNLKFFAFIGEKVQTGWREAVKTRGRKIIGARKSHVTFLRSGFVKAAALIIGQRANSRQHSVALVARAVPRTLRAAYHIQWPIPRSRSAASGQAILDRAHAEAVAYKTADLWKYIDRKNAELCRQFSGV